MNENPNLTPPKKGVDDHALSIIHTFMSGVPVVGGSGKELMNALVTPPIERRLQKWRTDVGSALEQLLANQ